MAVSTPTQVEIHAERDVIEASFRARFDDAPAIYFITKGGVVGAGRMSEAEAWELCRKAAASGKKLEFYKAPPGVDLA